MGLFSEAGLTGYVEKNKIGPLYHTTYKKGELKALRNLKRLHVQPKDWRDFRQENWYKIGYIKIRKFCIAKDTRSHLSIVKW